MHRRYWRQFSNTHNIQFKRQARRKQRAREKERANLMETLHPACAAVTVATATARQQCYTDRWRTASHPHAMWATCTVQATAVSHGGEKNRIRFIAGIGARVSARSSDPYTRLPGERHIITFIRVYKMYVWKHRWIIGDENTIGKVNIIEWL